MPRAEIVLMQFDIAGHSKIDVPERTLLEVRSRLARYVTAVTTAAGARNLQWQGDGGWCYFVAQEAAVFEAACDAGLDVLHCLPRINDWCNRTGRMSESLVIRLSLDSMNVELDDDVGHLAGRDMNTFLKRERDIGLANTLIVTQSVYRQLPRPFAGRFDEWKNVGGLGKLYAYQGKATRNNELKAFRKTLRETESAQCPGAPAYVALTTFRGERYADIAHFAYEGVDADVLPPTGESPSLGSMNFLVFRNALVSEVVEAARSVDADLSIEDIAASPYEALAHVSMRQNRRQRDEMTEEPLHHDPMQDAIGRATHASEGEQTYAGGELIHFCSPATLGLKYAIGESTELDCVAAGQLRIDAVVAGVEAPDDHEGMTR